VISGRNQGAVESFLGHAAKRCINYSAISDYHAHSGCSVVLPAYLSEETFLCYEDNNCDVAVVPITFPEVADDPVATSKALHLQQEMMPIFKELCSLLESVDGKMLQKSKRTMQKMIIDCKSTIVATGKAR
jgi:hypothetical protein